MSQLECLVCAAKAMNSCKLVESGKFDEVPDYDYYLSRLQVYLTQCRESSGLPEGGDCRYGDAYHTLAKVMYLVAIGDFTWADGLVSQLVKDRK